MNQNDFGHHLETSSPSKSGEHASPLFLLAALPFFTDPAALSLLLFGVIITLITIGIMVYFIVVKGRKKAEDH